jgi:hypothetical protein
MRIPVPVDATLLASLSWVGHIHLRVEEIAPTESAAADTTESLQTILTLVKGLENAGGVQPFDTPTRALLSSVKVERQSDEVLLTATVPVGMLEHMMDATEETKPVAVPVPVPGPVPAPKKGAKK